MEEKEILKELIALKSYSERENEEIINYLISKFSEFSEEIIKVKCENDERENLIIGVNTKLKNVSGAIVLSGHIDTVVADEKEYVTNPYVATESNGKLFGLGTIDMKSFFACILKNIEKLKALNSPVIIVATGDEETSLTGAQVISKKLKELNIKPKLTIVGEPTNFSVCTQAKSCMDNEIIVYGKSCHSSMPQNGINSNYIASRLMLYIEKLCKKFKGTVLNSNVVCGGEKVNIVPSQTRIRFDIRSKSRVNSEKALNLLKNFAKKLEKRYVGSKIEFTTHLNILPLEKRKSTLINSILKKFNLEESSFPAGCEAGFYAQVCGGDAIVFGVGDLALAHKPNEFVVICELERYCKLLFDVVSYVQSLN